jgi:hypothetical protein
MMEFVANEILEATQQLLQKKVQTFFQLIACNDKALCPNSCTFH